MKDRVSITIIAGGIADVRLIRADKMNALDPAMMSGIAQAMAELERTNGVRCVVLSGEGRSFCAGLDMASMAGGGSGNDLAARSHGDANLPQHLAWGWRTLSVPVIAAVQGVVSGGGFQIMSGADIRIARPDSRMAIMEMKWGLVPAVISPFVTERAGAARVREWFLTAKVFKAPEALQGGLINFSGSMTDVDKYLEDTFKLILAAAPEAVQDSKKLQQSYSTINWKKVEPQVTKLIAKRRVSAEGQKGLKAFLDKQTPVWSESPYGKPAAKI